MTSVRRLAVALLVAGVAAAGCTGGGDGPAAAGPASTAAPATPARTLYWVECRLPPAPGALVRAVAAGGGGAPWTAVGQQGGVGGEPVRPAVWTSPDGCAWRPAAVEAVTPDGERTGFSAVARRGALVVAQGRSYSQVHGNIRPTLWRATGGGPLREVEMPREVFGGEGGISVDALVSTPDAVLATGAYVTGGSVATQLWRSTEGSRWTRLPPGPDQTSTAGEQLLPRDLAAGPGGTLVVGTAFQVSGGDGFDGAAWYAPAGAARWRRADLAGSGLVGDGDQRLLADTALGRGFVAVGAVRADDGFRLRATVSADGTTWTAGGELPGRPLPPAGRPLADVAAMPGGGVVAAAATTGGTALWRSRDGRSWAPETVPGTAAGTTAVVLGPGPDRLVLVVQTPDGPRVHMGRPTG